MRSGLGKPISVTHLDDLSIETLSVYYSEATRIAEDYIRRATVAKTSENNEERTKYKEFQEKVAEYGKYAMQIDEIIQKKLSDICGKK